MKTSSKSLEKCQVSLTVSLDAEEIKAIVKNIEREFVREVELPGFRKGKVPVEMVRKQFAKGIKEEVYRAMFRDHYSEAVKAESIQSVAVCDYKDVSYDENGGTFTVVLDVKPTFKVPAYKGLKIEFKEVVVTDDEVNNQITRLRAAYSKFETAKEGEACAEGDLVSIDYSGMIGKKSILEINPEAKVVAEGKDFWIQLEEGRFLPEILDAVKGMKIGETKEGVKAKFDKDSAPEGLKGEKAVYTVTLKSFRHRILPTDAEFIENTKVESLEKLIETIRNGMQEHASKQEQTRREAAVIEQLMKKADFDVPRTQVASAMEAYLKELSERAQKSGLTVEYFEKNRDQILKDAEATAQNQVRLMYILDTIAEAEKIEASDEDRGMKVIEYILENAKK